VSSVTIVDYGLANIRSVVNALSCFPVEVRMATDGEGLRRAERVVLPGVGSFDAGMRALRERGHVEALEEAVLGRGVPFLGLCLGMQFLFEGSDEGTEPGLRWIPGRVRRFPASPGVKVPHMGWSEVAAVRPGRLLARLAPPLDFYFVHSYCVPAAGEALANASTTCEHGLVFVASIEADNVCATQFHPEKSQLAGMKLLETFLALP